MTDLKQKQKKKKKKKDKKKIQKRARARREEHSQSSTTSSPAAASPALAPVAGEAASTQLVPVAGDAASPELAQVESEASPREHVPVEDAARSMPDLSTENGIRSAELDAKASISNPLAESSGESSDVNVALDEEGYPMSCHAHQGTPKTRNLKPQASISSLGSVCSLDSDGYPKVLEDFEESSEDTQLQEQALAAAQTPVEATRGGLKRKVLEKREATELNDVKKKGMSCYGEVRLGMYSKKSYIQWWEESTKKWRLVIGVDAKFQGKPVDHASLCQKIFKHVLKQKTKDLDSLKQVREKWAKKFTIKASPQSKPASSSSSAESFYSQDPNEQQASGNSE